MNSTLQQVALPEALVQALRDGLGILVTGKTASGKTVLASQLGLHGDGGSFRCLLTNDLLVTADASRKAVAIAGMGIPVTATIFGISADEAWREFAKSADITLSEAKRVFPVVVLMARTAEGRVIESVVVAE